MTNDHLCNCESVLSSHIDASHLAYLSSALVEVNNRKVIFVTLPCGEYDVDNMNNEAIHNILNVVLSIVIDERFDIKCLQECAEAIVLNVGIVSHIKFIRMMQLTYVLNRLEEKTMNGPKDAFSCADYRHVAKKMAGSMKNYLETKL